MDDIRLNHDIAINKIGWISAVGQDAPYPGCRQKDIFRALFIKKIFNIPLPGKIKFSMGTGNKIHITHFGELSYQGRAYKTPVTRDVDL